MAISNNNGLTDDAALRAAIAASLADNDTATRKRKAPAAAAAAAAATDGVGDAGEPGKRRRLNDESSAAGGSAAAGGGGGSGSATGAAGTLQGRQVAYAIADIALPVYQISGPIMAAIPAFPLEIAQLITDYIAPRRINANDLFMKVLKASLLKQELPEEDELVLAFAKDQVQIVDLSNFYLMIQSDGSEPARRVSDIYAKIIDTYFPNLRHYILPDGGYRTTRPMDRVRSNYCDAELTKRRLTKNHTCRISNSADVPDRCSITVDVTQGTWTEDPKKPKKS